MDSRIPDCVKPLLQKYVERLQSELPDLITGVYLTGSISYDAFSPEISDIDVLTVTERACSRDQLQKLKSIHAALKYEWPEWKLEVSYVPLQDCKDWRPGRAVPHPFHHQDPYHENPVFKESGIFDFNSPIWAANVWWMVKTHGIPLSGAPIEELELTVTADDIYATNRHLVYHLWPDWLNPRRNLLQLRVPFTMDWVVLGVLRTYYTLRERDITSKLGAAEYGLKHLPVRWHWLIKYCLKIRKEGSREPLLKRAMIGAMAAFYLNYILRECRQIITSD